MLVLRKPQVIFYYRKKSKYVGTSYYQSFKAGCLESFENFVGEWLLTSTEWQTMMYMISSVDFVLPFLQMTNGFPSASYVW